MNTNIYSLPIELVDQVFAALLWTIGPRKSLRLRVVNELFDAAILRTIRHSFTSDRHGPFHQWLKIRRNGQSLTIAPLVAMLLLGYIKSDFDHPLLLVLHTAMNSLSCHHSSLVSDEEITRRDKNICLAMADYLDLDMNHELVKVAALDSKGQDISPEALELPSGYDHGTQNLLSVAIAAGNITLVRELLLSGRASIKCENPHFPRPLNIAAGCGHREIFELLIDHGADPQAVQPAPPNMHPATLQSDTKDYTGFAGSALEAACRHGHVDIVRLLLRPDFKGPSTVNITNALHIAARFGHVEVMKVLCPSPEELLLASGSFPPTLFLWACKYGCERVVRYLLDQRLSPDNEPLRYCRRNSLGRSFAESAGRANVVLMLLKYNAFHQQDSTPQHVSPLHFEDGYKSVESRRALGDQEKFQISIHGPYLLQKSVLRNHIPMICLIMDLGIDLNTKHDAFHTIGLAALFTAIENGFEQAVRILVNAGVPPNHDNQKYDAVLHAKCRSQEAILRVLNDLGGQDVDVSKSIFAAEFDNGLYPLEPIEFSSDGFETLPPEWKGRDF